MARFLKVFLFVCFLHLGIVEIRVNGEPCSPTVKCITSDTMKSCRERGLHYQENVHFGGCCPGCRKMPEVGEACDDANPCAPGALCNKKFVCVVNTASGCEKERLAAIKTHRAYLPDCLEDDTFAPKQCKGEPMAGRCFCSDPKGQRIFGEQQWIKADNMTCACSRLMWEMLQVRPDASLHCNDQGNFEELQCDDGVCWCAREQTGEPFSIIVPEKMMKALPCYNSETYGVQYLRNCDSQRVAQAKAKELLLIHGTDGITFTPVNCNYDGSFARVQIKENQQVCSAKDGSVINPYPTGLGNTVNCNCVYDKWISEDTIILTCDQNGDYLPKQAGLGSDYCVDSDGFYQDCPAQKGYSG